MTHTFHQGPGHFWYDSCLECNERADSLPDSINKLDDVRRIRAWQIMRAVRWVGGHPNLPKPTSLSQNDRALINCLYTIAVFMERMGFPPGDIEDMAIRRLKDLAERAAAMGMDMGDVERNIAQLEEGMPL